MAFSRIKYIDGRGPGARGDVLFLESAPTYSEAAERIAELKHEYPGYEIVIYRLSRLPPEHGERGKFLVTPERPESTRPSSNRKETEGSEPINCSLYAIRAPRSAGEAILDENKVTQEVIAISEKYGQQGDPTSGGNH